MSFDSFDDFFSSGKSETSKMANLEVILSQLFNFSEKMFTQLATIIDQLDEKVTKFEAKINSTFFIFLVDNFKGVVFFETIIKTF